MYKRSLYIFKYKNILYLLVFTRTIPLDTKVFTCIQEILKYKLFLLMMRITWHWREIGTVAVIKLFGQNIHQPSLDIKTDVTPSHHKSSDYHTQFYYTSTPKQNHNKTNLSIQN